MQAKVSSLADSPAVPLRPDQPLESSGVRVRLFALLTLLTVVAFFAFAAHTAWQAMRDSFVVPAILSPDNDLVLNNKLRLSELEVERARAGAELEGIDGDIAAAEQASRHLQELQRTVASAGKWTRTITSKRASASAAERGTLGEQRRLLALMLEKQKVIARKAEADVEAGLISRAEYAREQQTVHQLELALLDNARATLQTESASQELAGAALASGGGAPLTGELLVRREQGIRIGLELTRLGSELRTKLAQKRALLQRLAKIDELSAQLRDRPVFRAAARSLEVAFVPYTQMDSVVPNAPVLSCRWGLFFCRPVGTVAEVVPGEVMLPDPWGSQARGQYAILSLQDHDSAKAKTLRIRRPAPESGPVEAPRPAATAALSSR